MAKIILNVELKSADVRAQLKTLQGGIDALAQSLQNIRVNKDLTAQLNALTKYYNAIASAAQKATTATEKRQLAEQKLATEVARTNTQQAKYAAQVEKLNQVRLKSINSVDRLQKQYASLLLTMKNASKSYPRGTFDEYTKQVTANLEAVKALNAQITSQNGKVLPEQQKQLQDLSAQFSRLSADITTTRGEAKKTQTEFGSMVTGFMKWTVAATLVMQSVNLIKSAFADLNETLVETEKRTIAIRRVLNEDIAADDIANDLYNLAIAYGQTFDNVADIAESFAKTGMDWAESIQATRAALLALNVAELDSEAASEGLVAIMVQYGKDASELTDIIDKLNKTADRFPVSTEEILLALQKTGSYANQANMSLEETVAVITALSSATNASGQQLGTAIKSLLAYTTRSSSLDTYAALSPDMEGIVAEYRKGAASILEVWQGLSAEMQHLSKEQADMLADYAESAEGQALEEALGEELGEVYDDMTGVYDTAGTYRKNYFIALMSNFAEVSDALEEMEDAQGYSQKENLQYLDTYEAKLNSLNAQWQKMLNSEQGFLDFKKDLVDMGSRLLDIVAALGGVDTIVKSIIAAVAPYVTVKFFASLRTHFIALSNLIKGVEQSAKSASMGLNTALGVVGAILSIITLAQGAIEGARLAQQEAISEGMDELDELGAALDETRQKYDDLSVSITDYREVLESGNSTEKERESALESLKKLQDNLIQSNAEYADSIDLVNGKLEEQLKSLEAAEFQEVRNQMKDFVEENLDLAANAQSYLSGGIKQVEFAETSHFWDFGGDKRLLDWLTDHGYNEWDGDYKSGLSDWYSVIGILSNVAIQSNRSGGLTPEEWKTTLETLMEQIRTDAELSQTDREYLLGQVQGAFKTMFGEGSTYSEVMDFLEGDRDSENFAEWLSKEQRDALAYGQMSMEEYQRLLEEFLEGIGELDDETDSVKEETDKWENSLSHVSREYEKIAEEMRELRSESQKALEIEQARQDLMNKAGGEVNIARVVDAETGEFRLQVDRSLSDDVLERAEEAAFDEVVAELESGDATNQSILDILDTWDKAGLPQESIDAIKDMILQVTGVDLDLPELQNGVPVYDEGGVLTGMGGIKATAEDELVLPPWLTEQILRPTPTKESRAAIERAMAAMVTPILPPPESGVVYTFTGGGTRDSYNNTTTTDNRQYYINGVPIPARAAETHTLLEIVEGMSLV